MCLRLSVIYRLPRPLNRNEMGLPVFLLGRHQRKKIRNLLAVYFITCKANEGERREPGDCKLRPGYSTLQ